MKEKNILVPLFAAFVLLFPKDAAAWHSVWPQDTHFRIGTGSVQNLDEDHQGAYPDLVKYSLQISNGANKESHTLGKYTSPSELDNSRNGGIPKTWWDEGLDGPLTQNPDNAVFHYKSLNQPKAYEYIGRMAHLIQDQGVPAHAANIRHGYWSFGRLVTDNLEMAAGLHYSYNNVTTNLKMRPDKFYQSLQNDTRGQLQFWIDPKTGKQYWYPAPAPSFNPDATFGPFGTYGGGPTIDIYDYDVEPAPAIMNRQLRKTSEFTQGALMSASELLPPIVYEMEILGDPPDIPVISDEYYTPIEFTLTENRVKDLAVDVYIDGVGKLTTKEPVVFSLDAGESYDGNSKYAEIPGEITWERVPVPLFRTADANLAVLPFKSKVRLSWKADGLADTVKDGPYTLCAEANDFDGIHSPVSPDRENYCHQFKLDRHPPVLTLGGFFETLLVIAATNIICANNKALKPGVL